MKIDIQCGDIILFDRPCIGMDFLSSMTCFAAKSTSFSNYDHLGLVVEDPSSGKVFLLEANANGVTLYPLDDRLRRTKASQIAVRKLVGHRSAQFKEELWNLAKDRNGKVYNRNFIQMSSAFFSSYWNTDAAASPKLTKLTRNLTMIRNEINSNHHPEQSIAHQLLVMREKQLTDHLKALNKNKKKVETNVASAGAVVQQSSTEALDSYYCSQLVAEVLAHQGIIMTIGRKPENYLPADFSSTTARKNLIAAAAAGAADHHNSSVGVKGTDSSGSSGGTTSSKGGCYHYSPDLAITSPRALRMVNKDGVCSVEIVEKSSSSSKTTAASAVGSQSSNSNSTDSNNPSSETAVPKQTEHTQQKQQKQLQQHQQNASVKHEWVLSVDDVLSPQITHQLPYLLNHNNTNTINKSSASDSDSSGKGVLEVTGCVDVLTSDTRYIAKDKTESTKEGTFVHYQSLFICFTTI